jgi:adenosylcobinamide-GDP ribazoletransferase
MVTRQVLSRLDDLRVAAAFLTRLPMPAPEGKGMAAVAGACRAYPLIGIGIGLAAGGVCLAALGLGLGVWLAAILAVTCQVVLSGALHEDGLADVADGLGGYDRERRLEIMRDSRIGAYGVLALILATGLRVAAIASLAGDALVALVVAAALSRAVMAWPMVLLPPARDDGLAAGAGRPNVARVVEGTVIALALAVAISGLPGLLALALAAFAALSVARLAERTLGGTTGDVIGATQVVAEIAVLLALVTLTGAY